MIHPWRVRVLFIDDEDAHEDDEDDEDTPTFEDHLAGLDDEDWGDDTPMEGMCLDKQTPKERQMSVMLNN